MGAVRGMARPGWDGIAQAASERQDQAASQLEPRHPQWMDNAVRDTNNRHSDVDDAAHLRNLGVCEEVRRARQWIQVASKRGPKLSRARCQIRKFSISSYFFLAFLISSHLSSFLLISS